MINFVHNILHIQHTNFCLKWQYLNCYVIHKQWKHEKAVQYPLCKVCFIYYYFVLSKTIINIYCKRFVEMANVKLLFAKLHDNCLILFSKMCQGLLVHLKFLPCASWNILYLLLQISVNRLRTSNIRT